MRLRILPLGLFFLLTVSISAQSVSESVTIEVVDVPVYVTRNGTPVKGLMGEDFELFVNGKIVPIEYFDVVSAEVPVGGEVPAGDLRQRRLTLLLFDLAFTNVISTTRARRAAGQLIAGAPEGDLFAIASYSSVRGIRFATPFTRDRAALARGIASLNATRSGDPLSIVMSDSEREQVYAPERLDLADLSIAGQMAGEAERDIALTLERRAAEDQVAGLTELSARLASLQGQKHVVLLSEGTDGRNRRDSIQMASSASGYTIYRTGISSAIDGGGFGNRVLTLMERLGDAFQASDVFLHTVDVEGVGALLGSPSLYLLAEVTGGRFVHNRNDLGAALTDLSTSVSHGYVLGFVPRNVRAGQNEIEVRLREPKRGTTLHYREGFSGTARKTDVSEGLYLADVVMNDVPQSGTAATLSSAGGKLTATVPMAELAAQLGGSGSAELLVYLFSKDGVAVGFQRHTIEVRADSPASKVIKMSLPADAQVAKALLLVNDSLGFSRAAL